MDTNNQAPVDPSNTSDIGQKVEQNIVSIKEGMSKQNNETEDKAERNSPLQNEQAENYLKHPSLEEKNSA